MTKAKLRVGIAGLFKQFCQLGVVHGRAGKRRGCPGGETAASWPRPVGAGGRRCQGHDGRRKRLRRPGHQARAGAEARARAGAGARDGAAAGAPNKEASLLLHFGVGDARSGIFW